MKSGIKGMAGLVLALLLTVLTPAAAFAAPEWPSDTGIQSEAGIVMDMDSGAVLFGQNIHVKRAPASIVKVLTALVVIENASPDETVTFSHDAVYNVEEGSGNKNAIEEGDQMTVRDALHFMLLTSSNQAANALAEHVGGSREGFVEMMNEKAAELGCSESHFANPSGLNDETQLTTPYDMALIGREAYSNPDLLEIGSALSYRLPATANNPEGVTISMEHKMLQEGNEVYDPDAVAGKTGYTSVAGQTLMTYAVRGDRRLLAVTMKSTEFTHYTDTIALLDFGFQSFRNLKIAEQETADGETVKLGETEYPVSDLSVDPDAAVTVPRDASFGDVARVVKTDLPADRPVGAKALLTYLYHDRKVGETYVISESAAAAENAEAQSLAAQEANGTGAAPESEAPAEQPQQKKGISGKTVGILVGVLAAAVLVILFVLYLKRKQEEERRLQEQRHQRRMERLKEMGCSREEFDRLLKERTGRDK